MLVTNIAKGARGLNTDHGPVLIEPGQTWDVDLSPAEAKIAKASGWFAFGKPAAVAPAEAA